MATDFSSFKSISATLDKVLSIQSVGSPATIPTPLILFGVPKRSGLSPTKIASRIIARKSEAGIPVGALPSGGVSPDELMERIRVEEIIKAIQEEALLSVAIPAGTSIIANGASPAGPVTVYGNTITFTKGYGVIQ